MIRIYLLLSFLVIGVLSQSSMAQTTNEFANIPLGGFIEMEGIFIKFDSVLEDSRCPASVQCIWEGEIKIRVGVRAPGKSAEYRELTIRPIPNPQPRNWSDARTIFWSTEFEISADGVTPYPEHPGESLDYVLRVRKSEVNN